MKSKACDLCKCTVTPTFAMKHLDEFANKICEHESKLENLNLIELGYLDGVTSPVQNQLNDKYEILSSNTELQNYTKSNLAYYDGSLWEKKSGNVSSNGGGFPGTFINVNSTTYWERKIIDYVTPEMFGATGNGIIDERLILQTVLNTPYDVKFLKNKIYKVSDVITVNSTNNSKKKIYFESGVKIISTQPANNANTLLYFLGDFDGLEIQGTNTEIYYETAPTVRTQNTILVSGRLLKNIKITGLNVKNSANFGIFVVAGWINETVTGSENCYIANCIVENTLGDGIHVENFDRNVTIENIIHKNNGDDVIAVTSYDGTGVAGKHLSPTENVTIRNIQGTGATTSVISLAGCKYFSVSNVNSVGTNTGIGLKLVHSVGYTQPNSFGYFSDITISNYAKGLAFDTPSNGTQYNTNIVVNGMKMINQYGFGIFLSNATVGTKSLLSNITLLNIDIISHSSNVENAIYVSNTENVNIENVKIYNYLTGGILAGNTNLKVNDLKFESQRNSLQYGFAINTSSVKIGNVDVIDLKISPDLITGIGFGSNIKLEYLGYINIIGATSEFNYSGTQGISGVIKELINSTDGLNIFHRGGNALSWTGANGYKTTFSATTNVSDLSYTLPGTTGTLALTSQLSNYLPLSGSSIISGNSLSLTGTSQTALNVNSGGTNQSAYVALTPTGSGSGFLSSSGALAFQAAGLGELARFNISGNLLIGTTSNISSAKVVINSTTQGVLLPRMTTTQRDAIVSPAEGLEIYNLTTHTKDFYNGTVWKTITTN